MACGASLWKEAALVNGHPKFVDLEKVTTHPDAIV
jgi:hypothetical protein